MFPHKFGPNQQVNKNLSYLQNKPDNKTKLFISSHFLNHDNKEIYPKNTALNEIKLCQKFLL